MSGLVFLSVYCFGGEVILVYAVGKEVLRKLYKPRERVHADVAWKGHAARKLPFHVVGILSRSVSILSNSSATCLYNLLAHEAYTS